MIHLMMWEETILSPSPGTLGHVSTVEDALMDKPVKVLKKLKGRLCDSLFPVAPCSLGM